MTLHAERPRSSAGDVATPDGDARSDQSGPTRGMSVGAVTEAWADPPASPPPAGIRSPRRRRPRRRRWLVTVPIVAAILAALAWWPPAPPPALLPDAVGETPRAPSGPVAWRWTLPQEGAVQYLDVVDDALVLMDLHTSVGVEGPSNRPAVRLRLIDTLTGTTRWTHRMLGSEAVVLVDGDAPVTSVVPSALGNPAVVVALDWDDGHPRWRTGVRDVDGIATADGRVVVHGADGCLELGPASGEERDRVDGGRCLPWGPMLASAQPDGWQLFRDGATFGALVSGTQPPVSVAGRVVTTQDGQVVATTPDGESAWALAPEHPPDLVRPFADVGVRVEGREISTIVDPAGEVVAQVPWWYRGIVTPDGLTFLDVPTTIDQRRAHVIRIVGPNGRVLASTGLRPGADPDHPASASAAVAGRVGPSMFCPTTTVSCRARRWPAVRLTADGVLMEDLGALGLHGLDDLAPRWQVDLDGAEVTALAASRHGVVALVTDENGRAELRGYA